MQPLQALRSRTVVIPLANVDTDQIIPARFLTTTTKEGLGKQLWSLTRLFQRSTLASHCAPVGARGFPSR
jgi:3-isopropylmalate dehydratase small subunit